MSKEEKKKLSKEEKKALKEEKKKRKEAEGKKTISERVSLFLRKRCLNNGIETALIICILIGAFISLNLYVDTLDLKDIDVTANKIYTLSDASKDIIKNIDEDIKIYLFGYTEDDTLTDFVKQYVDTNNHISYEIESRERLVVYDEVDITKMILELKNENLVVKEIKEVEESLESYYLNLLGGSNHDKPIKS